MKLNGFIGPAYVLDSVNVEAQQCVNLYPVMIETGTAKEGEIAYLRHTPGLEVLCTVGTGPIRLVHVDSVGRIFVVSGNQLFRVKKTGSVWSGTLIGIDGEAGGAPSTFGTTSGPVKAESMSYLGDGTDSSTVFVDGDNNYLFLDNGNNTSNFGPLSAFGYGDVADAKDITWIDGYFIVNSGNTNKFFTSDLGSFNIDALEFASAEGSPDSLLAVMSNHRDLWLFGERSTEVFSNTGNADFPFERIQGGFIEIGCCARYSVAKIDGTLLWLGRTEYGQGIVYSAKGLGAQRISTHAIEQAMSSYQNISNAQAFTYEYDGHKFYVLNFAEATWVYDLSTNLWHERAYTNEGTLQRHRAGYHAFAPNESIHIVGDYENNKIYRLADDVKKDGDVEITRIRSSPHISNGSNLLFCSRFQLDMETGIGVDGGGEGSSPMVVMDFSDDGGHTWSTESWAFADASAGQIGEYKTRVIWRRLGSFRDRVFRVKITAPVKVILLGAQIEVKGGA